MKCFSEKTTTGSGSPANRRTEGKAMRRRGGWGAAFSLPEVVAALVIMSLVASSILLVINRSMTSVADITLRMQAFEVARENMEYLLAVNAAEEMTDYGTSEKYPEIEWQTTVERFEVPTNPLGSAAASAANPVSNLFENFGLSGMGDANAPLASETWVRALCTAEYTDTDGEVQTVELVHWLTKLTEQQKRQIAWQEKLLAERIYGKDISELDQDQLDELEQLTRESRDAARLDRDSQDLQSRQDQPGRQDQQQDAAKKRGPGPPPGEKGMTEEEFKAFIDEIFKKFQQN